MGEGPGYRQLKVSQRTHMPTVSVYIYIYMYTYIHTYICTYTHMSAPEQELSTWSLCPSKRCRVCTAGAVTLSSCASLRFRFRIDGGKSWRVTQGDFSSLHLPSSSLKGRTARCTESPEQVRYLGPEIPIPLN